MLRVSFDLFVRVIALLGIAGLSFNTYAENLVLPPLIRLIVPFTPGASNDIFGRAVAEQLTTKLGIPVVVENKPGAGGIIGSSEVARAKPDGSTLLFSSNSFVTRAAIDERLPFDPRTSFVPVALVAQGAMLLVVSNETHYENVADLIADSKRRNINFGSAGIGSIGQLSGELFVVQAGIEMTHVPYKGITPGLTDMIGGRLFSMITTPASIGMSVKAGQIKALAVTSLTRSVFFPELPTVAETVPGYSTDVWWGVYAPANTPKVLIDHLNQAIRDISSSTKMRNLFAKEAAEPSSLNAAEFGAYVNQELDKWQKLAKERGIKNID